MALFKKVENTNAYLKMGIYGDAGSGKTYTASQVAKGLAAHIKEVTGKAPPVMFIDTETGLPWVKPLFEAAGIELLGAQTRAFSDLREAVREAEAAGAILIVDLISHFWQEVQDAYLKAKQERIRKSYAKLEFQDYAILKPLWAQFTTAYLNSKAHIILCGRAGGTYEYQENEETHKKELITTGTKMRAEKDMGYEPSLLVEMVIEKDLDDRKKRKTVRRAFIIKDRSDLLDGMEFLDPTFKEFKPHIDRLNLGGAHAGFDTSRSSSALFPTDDRDDRSLQRKIVLDEIESLLTLHYPSTGGADRKAKLEALKNHFKASWTEIEKVMPLEDLRAGYDALHRVLEKASSRYTLQTAVEAKQTPVEEDSVPEFDKGAATAKDKVAKEEFAAVAGTAVDVQGKEVAKTVDVKPARAEADATTSQSAPLPAPSLIASTRTRGIEAFWRGVPMNEDPADLKGNGALLAEYHAGMTEAKDAAAAARRKAA